MIPASRAIGAGETDLSTTDNILNIDTTLGAAIINLPSVATWFELKNKSGAIYDADGLRFTDVSGTAAINNITFVAADGDLINGETTIVVNTNNASGVVTPTLDGDNDSDNVWEFSFVGTTVVPESAGLLSKTYAEMITLQGASGFVAGQQYLITDFATKHFIVAPNGTQYDIVTGVTEPIIVTAVSTTMLDKNAMSTLYPQDILHYELLPDIWLASNDPAFVNQFGQVMVTGFKGAIYFRHDTILDNYTGYDFRNCKFRRWKTNTSTWEATTYLKGSFVNDEAFIYKALKDAADVDVPSSTDSVWVKLLDLSLTEYYNNNASSTNGINSGTDFIDVKTFADDGGAGTYEACCRGNHIDSFKADFNVSSITPYTILSNNVFFLKDLGRFTVLANEIGVRSFGNTIAGTFSYNSIANTFYGNQIGGDAFESNTIGNYFYENIIAASFIGNTTSNYFYSNTIGEEFTYNTINNKSFNNVIGNEFAFNIMGGNFKNNYIGNRFDGNYFGSYIDGNSIGDGAYSNNCIGNFSFNTIGNEFGENNMTGYVRSNIIGNNMYSNNTSDAFSNNTISADFYNNNISTFFTSNIIASAFILNTIGNKFEGNTTSVGNTFQQNQVADNVTGLDFTSATLVYLAYTKQIFVRSDGSKRLSYIDNTDAITYASPTA